MPESAVAEMGTWVTLTFALSERFGSTVSQYMLHHLPMLPLRGPELAESTRAQAYMRVKTYLPHVFRSDRRKHSTSADDAFHVKGAVL